MEGIELVNYYTASALPFPSISDTGKNDTLCLMARKLWAERAQRQASLI